MFHCIYDFIIICVCKCSLQQFGKHCFFVPCPISAFLKFLCHPLCSNIIFNLKKIVSSPFFNRPLQQSNQPPPPTLGNTGLQLVLLSGNFFCFNLFSYLLLILDILFFVIFFVCPCLLLMRKYLHTILIRCML